MIEDGNAVVMQKMQESLESCFNCCTRVVQRDYLMR
jgi:hypothetical protein